MKLSKTGTNCKNMESDVNIVSWKFKILIMRNSILIEFYNFLKTTLIFIIFIALLTL